MALLVGAGRLCPARADRHRHHGARDNAAGLIGDRAVQSARALDLGLRERHRRQRERAG